MDDIGRGKGGKGFRRAGRGVPEGRGGMFRRALGRGGVTEDTGGWVSGGQWGRFSGGQGGEGFRWAGGGRGPGGLGGGAGVSEGGAEPNGTENRLQQHPWKEERREAR